MNTVEPSKESGTGPDSVSAGLLLGRIGLRHSELVPRTLGEAVSLQERLRAIGGTAPPIGQILRDLGLLDQTTVEHMLAWQRDGDTSKDDRLGELAVMNGFSTRERVRRAIERQAAASARSDPAQRLGELLVASGDLTPQAVRALLAAQARVRGKPAPSLGSDEPWEVVPGGYRVSGEMLLLEQTPEVDELEPLPTWLIVLLIAALGSLAAIVIWGLLG